MVCDVIEHVNLMYEFLSLYTDLSQSEIDAVSMADARRLYNRYYEDRDLRDLYEFQIRFPQYDPQKVPRFARIINEQREKQAEVTEDEVHDYENVFTELLGGK